MTGGSGMLAQALGTELDTRDHEVARPTRFELDITRLPQLPGALDLIHDVDAVVNTAAWTAVDDAEADEAGAFGINATGAYVLARACAQAGTRLIHLSTDYVFAGDASSPYVEDAVLGPVSAYGRTKAAGEWAVRGQCQDAVIVRTAWLYGPGGRNFVSTMADLSQKNDQPVRVVDDQWGQPTSTPDLARFVADILERPDLSGVFHGTCQGSTSWHGLAQAVFEELGHDPSRVVGVPSTEYRRPAPRPTYSILAHDRSQEYDLAVLPPWRDSLTACLPALRL